MEIRLNKLISDAGICSRREADKFIEMGRVTVNGQQPAMGQKVTEKDVVLVDGEPVKVGKHSNSGTVKAATPKIENLVLGPKISRPRNNRSEKTGNKPTVNSNSNKNEEGSGSGRREHYGRYNKYAAARHARKEREMQEGGKPKADKEKVLREAMQPKFGKSLSRSAVAQRLASSSKSASLRKTSKNNPINKAKRMARRRDEE